MGSAATISFTELIRRLTRLGFRQERQKGSHIRFVHPDGRKTTVPDHGAKDVPRGLLTKIVRHDIKMSLPEFIDRSER